MKIDLVYLWVNGNDENWLKDKEYWQEKMGLNNSDSTNNCRFIETQELKYSLRSVAKYMPWINKIFIVTNGQIPEWLDTSHPKIRIVKHEEIMPQDALPTFNSEAIETCIANIPELSEYFIYANDDCFVNKPIKPDYFFDKKGNPIYRCRKYYWSKETIDTQLYQNTIDFCNGLINEKYNANFKYESTHNMDAYRKSYFKECINEYSDLVIKTTFSKFRQPHSFQRTMILLWGSVNSKSVIKDYTRSKKDYVISRFDEQGMNKLLKKYKPYLVCYNDNERITFEEKLNLKPYLAKTYSNRQEWEKDDNFQIEPVFGDDAKTIVTCPNDNWSMYFSVLLQSIIDNSEKSEKYDIIILETDISDKNKQHLLKMIPENFSLRFFNINSYIYETFPNLELKAKNNWTIQTYYRIFIPLIMQKYSKVLYLDSDMCVNHNLTELFEIDFEGNEALVVSDTVSPIINLPKHAARKYYMEQILELKDITKYFNAGMIMFNIKGICLDDYIEKFLCVNSIPELMFLDQDILNAVFHGKTKLISAKWNYIYGSMEYDKNYLNLLYGDYKEDFLNAYKNPYIIHYTTPRKPWIKPDVDWCEIFWNYAKDSPYYEKILFEMSRKNLVTKNMLVDFSRKYKIFYQYFRCLLFSIFTFGATRTHYLQKKKKYKLKIFGINELSKIK